MGRQLARRGLGLLCLALLGPGAQGAAPPAAKAPAAGVDAATLARKIDRHVAAGLQARRAVPAPMAGDSEFVRRVYLDLAGRIPRVSEVRGFLDDRRPDKRQRLVEKLLGGANYINHFTNVWRTQLGPQMNSPQTQALAGQIEQWARARVRDNTPYDKMVRDLITAPVAQAGVRGRQPTPQPGNLDPGALAFYRANEMKPDILAATTSRLFLGVKIECAQCHDHPFAKWTRKQFWEYAAFFAGIKTTNPMFPQFAPATDDPKVHEIAVGTTEKKVKARFLDGGLPAFQDNVPTRATLAEWMTSPDNPFFARAIANRMWEHLFGVGLVDPVDDFREENPATHPELLDDLAQGLIANRFDLKFLVRAITASHTYQRTSVMTHASQEDVRLFARVPIKGMSPEQVFDSLATAVGYKGANPPGMVRAFDPRGNTPRGEFLAKFANPVDRRTEHQTSILQALALMNGRFIADATSLDRSETLAAVLESPFMDTRQKLDTLYLATLARPMTGSEAGRAIPYVNGGGPSGNPKRALADIFWVLLNSSEFILNH